MEKDEVTFFKNAVSSLDIHENSSIRHQNFQNRWSSWESHRNVYHPSIILIKNKVDNQNKFSFKPVALSFFFLIGIHSMQGWTATTRHGVTRKGEKKDYRIQKIYLERTYS